MIGVNKIDIKAESIENCANIAFNFPKKINWYASKSKEVRVIFDKYDVESLKGNTRADQNKEIVPVQFKVLLI